MSLEDALNGIQEARAETPANANTTVNASARRLRRVFLL